MSAVAINRVPSFEWTRDALVEHCGQRTYVYGRWDRLFGCWRADGSGNAKPFAPGWPLLDRQGRPALREANTSADLVIEPSLECPEYLFARYAELIPLDVRRVAAPFASWQWVVLSMVRDEPDFANFLATELRCRGPGFVAGCLALAAAHALGRLERTELCRRLMHEKRANIVASVTSSPHGRALARWLGKLDAEAATTELCVMLLVVAEEDPVKSRVVGHLPSLTFPIVWAMLCVPSWACSVRLVELLAGCTGRADTGRADDLLDLCQFVESCCPDRKRDVAIALSRATNLEQLFRRADHWRLRVVDDVPFPQPPFAAQGPLRPLTSANMMRGEGDRMRNCVGRLAWQVVEGGRYFYRWRGPEPATIGLAQDASGRWRLDEVAGVDNEPLTAVTAERIERLLRAAGVDTSRPSGSRSRSDELGPVGPPDLLDEPGVSGATQAVVDIGLGLSAPTSDLAGPKAGRNGTGVGRTTCCQAAGSSDAASSGAATKTDPYLGKPKKPANISEIGRDCITGPPMFVRSDRAHPGTQPCFGARVLSNVCAVFLLAVNLALPAFSQGALEGRLLSRGQGLILDNDDDLANIPRTPEYRAFLPERIDLSDRFPTPGDQGNQNSCVGWSVGYAARAYYANRVEGRDLGNPANIPSPAYIYNSH